jgi:DNA-binding CsgD family transcriptional regulator
MRKVPTAERRRRVAELYLDDALPIEQRSSRALGERFGVSHRTILNDLVALKIAERLSRPPAAGLSKIDRQRRVREMYSTHTCAEIAEELGCSVQPIKSDVRKLGLEVRKAAPRRKRPEPEARTCDCGCGELARPGGRFKDWDHYRRATRTEVEAVAAEARSLYDSGMTLDEIEEARPDLPRHRTWRALRLVGAMMRPATRRPIHARGRLVKCKARDHDFCPHGDRERWVYDSQGTEYLSAACWAQYRGAVAWKSLLPLISSQEASWDRWGGVARQRWLGRLNAKRAPGPGGRPRGRPAVTASPEELSTIRFLAGRGWGRRAIATHLRLSEWLVRRALDA